MDNRAKGGTCDRCGQAHRKGTRTRVCTCCLQRYCVSCARAVPRCRKLRADTLALVDAMAGPRAEGPAPPPLLDLDADASAKTQPAPAECELPLPALEALLTAATMLPALPTVTWCPKGLQPRVGDVLTRLLHESVTLLETANGSEACTQAQQLLWIAPALLLRRPPRTKAKEGREAGDLALVHILRRRVAYAEQDRWQALLVDYLEERAAASEPKRPRGVEDGAVADRLETLANAVRKVEGGCLRAAAQLLRGDKRIPGNQDTKEKLEELTALPVDDTERAATQASIDEARACADAVPLIKTRTVRRKLRTIKRGAEPGPSGWRNSHIGMIGERPFGAEVLTRWCRLYSRGILYPWDARLWASVILVPLDKGEGEDSPDCSGRSATQVGPGSTSGYHRKEIADPHRAAPVVSQDTRGR